MIDFVNSRLNMSEDLIIVVYWIGYNLKPQDFDIIKGLKKRFIDRGLIRLK